MADDLMAGRERWEYLANTLWAGMLEDLLNRHGANGWELVQIISPSTSEYIAIFKRPLRAARAFNTALADATRTEEPNDPSA